MSSGPDAVIARIGALRLVPVVVLDEVRSALPLAQALKAGGLPVVEMTLRTPVAEAALREIAADPDLLAGAGTVLTAEQVDRAVAAGARFVVSPGFSPAVVRRCREADLPVFPGVATATELQAALAEGLDVVKFFPAEPLGGLAMIEALAAPFPSVRFMPTGGINPDNLGRYLAHPAVLAVGGSWMVPRAVVTTGDWARVTALTADAVAAVAQATAARAVHAEAGGATPAAPIGPEPAAPTGQDQPTATTPDNVPT
jgi:2-dehydro-3-deoxyphosphogluconate aldolase/(4S)-4-hydroxy-2-oxoglutarate aldolase